MFQIFQIFQMFQGVVASCLNTHQLIWHCFEQGNTSVLLSPGTKSSISTSIYCLNFNNNGSAAASSGHRSSVHL